MYKQCYWENLLKWTLVKIITWEQCDISLKFLWNIRDFLSGLIKATSVLAIWNNIVLLKSSTLCNSDLLIRPDLEPVDWARERVTGSMEPQVNWGLSSLLLGLRCLCIPGMQLSDFSNFLFVSALVENTSSAWIVGLEETSPNEPALKE